MIVALGSSTGDRRRRLDEAVAFLRGVSTGGVRVSTYRETEPMGGVATGRFLNAAAVLHTALGARAFFDACKAHERAAGRDPAAPRWGDRPIDLDLIDFDGRPFRDDAVEIPHPACLQRRFVLEPLLELLPDWVHPTAGIRGRDALDALS